MITEIRTLSAFRLIQYMIEHCPNSKAKTSNMEISELFALAAKVQESGNLTTEGLASIAGKIAEIHRLKTSETITIMSELNDYCEIDFEEREDYSEN